MATDGWVVEPREAPAALAEGFKAPTYPDVVAEYTALSEQRPVEPEPSREPLHAGSDWVTLAEKLDAGGMALLMKFGGTIGEPHAG